MHTSKNAPKSAVTLQPECSSGYINTPICGEKCRVYEWAIKYNLFNRFVQNARFI